MAPKVFQVPGVVTAAPDTVVEAVAASVMLVVPPPELTVVVKLAPDTPAPATVMVSPLLMPVPLATVSADVPEVMDPVVVRLADTHVHPM